PPGPPWPHESSLTGSPAVLTLRVSLVPSVLSRISDPPLHPRLPLVPTEPRLPPAVSVAVGMEITLHPPHRSVQAHFSAYGSYLERVWRRSAPPGKDARFAV